MSTTFNGNRFVLPFDTHTVNLAAKASTAISVGDLVCWNGTEVIPVNISEAGVTDSTANIAATFAGVASQTHLAIDTSGGYPVFPPPYIGIAVQTECLYNATIASGTYSVGTPVKGVVGSASSVAATTHGVDVIGYIAAEYTVATTSVRVRLISPELSPYNFFIKTVTP